MEMLYACLGGEKGAQELLTVLYYIRLVIKILQIFVPIALILWGTLDMAKGLIAGDEKKIKEAKKPLIQRFITAVIVFLIPFLVDVTVGFVTKNSDYKSCWIEATKDNIKDFSSYEFGKDAGTDGNTVK